MTAFFSRPNFWDAPRQPAPPGGWEYYFTGRGYVDENGDGGGVGEDNDCGGGDPEEAILSAGYTGPRDRAWAREFDRQR